MVYATPEYCISGLGKQMQFMRAERPDEWTMDEFIGGVEEMAKEIETLQSQLKELNTFDERTVSYQEQGDMLARSVMREKVLQSQVDVLTEALELFIEAKKDLVEEIFEKEPINAECVVSVCAMASVKAKTALSQIKPKGEEDGK